MIQSSLQRSGTPTTTGAMALLKRYNILINKGLVVRSTHIYYDESGKRQFIQDDVYEKDKNGNKTSNLIKHKSLLKRDRNCLSVLTGELFGGYIGIDIDIKGSTPDANDFFINMLKVSCNLELNDTLVTRTPSGGLHFLFKLTKNQMEKLRSFSQSQAKLFDKDIDVIYNKGRFIMAGMIRKKEDDIIIEYEIISKKVPCILPEYIFEEILRRTTKKTLDIKKVKIIKENVEVSEVSLEELSKKDEEINKYLQCLSPSKSDNRESWFKIGAVLYNEGCSFELFNNWSKQSNKYDKKGCVELWNSLGKRDDGYTIATLIKYAKEDNYNDNYTKIKESKPKKIIDPREQLINQLFIESPSDNKIGELFYHLYQGQYIYDGENMSWYTCNKYGIFFKDTEELISCRKKLSGEILPLITKYYANFMKTAKESERQNIAKNFNKINIYLTSVTKKKIIIENLKELYNVKKFREKMNKNKYLFAFDNGVYDLKNYEFRNAKLDELVFETAGYKYIPSNKTDRELIKKTIKEIFPEDDLYEYFMTILSLRLVKINELEEFYFMIGNASNGKGLITSLIENTFGKFSQTLNSNTFSQTKHEVNSEAASPAIASTYNSNIVFVNELSNKMKITADILKKISGNDKIKTRFLRENFFEFIPGYSLFFVSNFEPIIDGSDGGIQRRLRFIPFNVTFSDNPNPANNEKKINRELKQFFKEEKYCCAFFDILVKFYSKYIERKKIINVPEIVKYKSKECLNENDPLKLFMETCIEITNDNKDRIYSSQLMDSFTNYNGGQTRGYNFDKLKKRLTTEFNIKCNRTKNGIMYCGIREICENE